MGFLTRSPWANVETCNHCRGNGFAWRRQSSLVYRENPGYWGCDGILEGKGTPRMLPLGDLLTWKWEKSFQCTGHLLLRGFLVFVGVPLLPFLPNWWQRSLYVPSLEEERWYPGSCIIHASECIFIWYILCEKKTVHSTDTSPFFSQLSVSWRLKPEKQGPE